MNKQTIELGDTTHTTYATSKLQTTQEQEQLVNCYFTVKLSHFQNCKRSQGFARLPKTLLAPMLACSEVLAPGACSGGDILHKMEGPGPQGARAGRAPRK